MKGRVSIVWHRRILEEKTNYQGHLFIREDMFKILNEKTSMSIDCLNDIVIVISSF